MLMQKMAPELAAAAETLDEDVIKEFLQHGFHVDFPLTATGIALYSLMLGVSPETL